MLRAWGTILNEGVSEGHMVGDIKANTQVTWMTEVADREPWVSAS